MLTPTGFTDPPSLAAVGEVVVVLVSVVCSEVVLLVDDVLSDTDREVEAADELE
ncbi:hypothetical protein M3M35_07000 [Fructilactobacillus myrtifloralis]|uniref:Uncharacterized protein n=1 Tax=Fructilactobacillus myrtifloralis TaxID=2940301 RepID=A0ABY5BP70_9LACO|nr:hypothetical protein [Fructilactobacillus myrtifloralis]USS85030.1 hypothetical protein M3M35_07000 [Fructilactobacillus myrtifloralis]